MDRRLSQLIFGFLIVSKQAKNLWVRVVKSEMDPFGRETYQSQAAPSKHVRKSRHKTAYGYLNSLRRSRKLTTNVVGSVNLDWGQVNAYSSGASGPSKESGWAISICPDMGMGAGPG
jgi:hypothetical protein